MPKFWNEDVVWAPVSNDLEEGDIRKKSINGDGQAPYTLQVYQGGAWVDFFPRLVDGKIVDVNLPDRLEDGVVAPLEAGKVPLDVLPESVAILDEDGTLPLPYFPISVVPFETATAVLADNNTSGDTTLVDISALHMPLAADKCMHFIARLLYVATSGVGARFTITGPTASDLAYTSRFSLSATAETVNYCDAYNQPATANASTASASGNIAIIEGFIVPSTDPPDAELQVRFASAGGGLITVKPGSYLFTEQYGL